MYEHRKLIPSLRFDSDTDTADNTFAYEKERTMLINFITPRVPQYLFVPLS